MSNGNTLRRGSSVEPHATISAQDIVQGKPDRWGFLRKRGQKERVLENLHLSRHINWRQRFVVVQDGCCYCYADEVSRGPLQTFSLQGYNQIYRSRSDKARAAFVFRLEPASIDLQKKVHTFAATTDQDRLAWMLTFRDAMVKANEIKPEPDRSSSLVNEDVYLQVELPVFESEIQRKETCRSEDDDEEEDGESSGDDSNYDRLEEEELLAINQKQQRRNLPLPPVPQNHADEGDVSSSTHPVRSPASRPQPSRRTRTALLPPTPGASGEGSDGAPKPSKPPNPLHRPAVPLPSPPRDADATPATLSFSSSSSPPHSLPKVASRSKAPVPAGPVSPSRKAVSFSPESRPLPPQKPSRRLSEKDSLFDNSDRDAALKLVRECKSPGTFLIRKSRQGDSKVLVVMTSEDAKEYKIFTEQNQEVSLDKKTFFSTVDDLLDHYSKSPLPGRHQTLSRSYSTSSKH